jgi:glycosyltransferase involved in cell wall biosynthesis
VSSSDVDVVVGVPAHRGTHLAEALESLIRQTVPVRVVVADERVDPEVETIVARYAAAGHAVVYHGNERRLGMVGNWQRAFALARQVSPALEFFAWGSDHDVWHPRWAETMLAALRANDAAVAAYPRTARMDDERRLVPSPWRFETVGKARPLARFVAAQRRMSAGNMVYALYRADALARAGIFRPVLLPDRLLLLELALQGEFVQVDEILWYRRYAHRVTMRRQRASLFASPAPRYTLLPWWIVHAAVLARAGHRKAAAAGVSVALWLQLRRRLRPAARAVHSAKLPRSRTLRRIRKTRWGFLLYHPVLAMRVLSARAGRIVGA